MSSIVFFTRVYEKTGLYAYSIGMAITASIQVQKAIHLSLFRRPLHPGKGCFTSLFLVSDTGKKAVKRGSWFGFIPYRTFSIEKTITRGLMSVEYSNSVQAFWGAQNAMAMLFAPTIPPLVSSLVGYVGSLWFDVMILSALKQIWKKKCDSKAWS